MSDDRHTAATTPDHLVLGGGGILGEAWMSAVLAGLDEQDGFDSRDCRGFVGTSAGSIVAASLAAGVAPGSRLGSLPEPPPVTEPGAIPSAGVPQQALGLAEGLGSMVASAALSSTAGGGAAMRRFALSRVPVGRRSLAPLEREIARVDARWDGRLRVTAVDLERGLRVVFGAPGSPRIPVASAVSASCAIPGVFRPVAFEGRSYVDGGVWSPTNLDASAAGRGDRVLCLNPTGALRPSIAEPVGAIGPVSQALAWAEALALRRRGAGVLTIAPDRETLRVMGSNLMDPGPREQVIAAGVAQGRRLAHAARQRVA